MPRNQSRDDFDHFDEWESFEMEDDIYAGAEVDILDDWEDDGAIAQVREPAAVVSEPQVDSMGAEVFSLMDRANARRSSDLMELTGPSEDELSTIEEVGIDDYIDIVLAEDAKQGQVDDSDEQPVQEIQSESVSEIEVQEVDLIDEQSDEEVELVLQPLFEGLGVSLPTLFDEESEVEYKTTARLAKRLTDSNVNAVFVATTDGEGQTLSRKERKTLVRQIVNSTDALVIADISAPSTKQCVQIAGDCADAGAKAFVINLDSNIRDPYLLCEAVHAAHGQAAIFVKLVGDPETLPVSPEFLYDLPISGVIDATGDATFFLHLIAVYSGPVYIGSTSLIALGHLMGAAGVVLSNIAINNDLVELAFSGDAAAQAELALIERETGGSNQKGSRSIKMALEAEFLVSSTMRD